MIKNNYFVLSILSLFLCYYQTGLYAQCPQIVHAGDDQFLCAPNSTAAINGHIDGEYLSFKWTPTTGMDNPFIFTPTVNVTQTTSYELFSYVYGPNAVVNGDFEDGNTGFTSGYKPSPFDLTLPGRYDVTPFPINDNHSFANCPGTISGNNQMAITGSNAHLGDVWCQTVPVTPNTNYQLSFYVYFLLPPTSAISYSLTFNGIPVTSPAPINGGPCKGETEIMFWNSGSSTTMDICLNFTSFGDGNAISLDDISFRPICPQRDTVTIRVVDVKAVTSPSAGFIPCSGNSITLYGNGSSTGPNVSYHWETGDGNIVSGENNLSCVVNAAGTYTLNVTYDDGFAKCVKSSSVQVTETNALQAWIDPPPPLNCAMSTAHLFAGASQLGPSMYHWAAGPGGHFVSGVNSAAVLVNQPGDYFVTVTNVSTGCTAEASVTVQATITPPLALASASQLTCTAHQVTLSGAGSSTGPIFTYAWSTADTLGHIVSGLNSQNAVADAAGTYIFQVTNTVNHCTKADTVVVVQNTVAPTTALASPGTLTCLLDSLTLTANVSPPNATFGWTTPDGTIVSGADSLKAVVTASGVYIFTATNPANGCTTVKSDTVARNVVPPLAVIQPANILSCEVTSQTLSGAGSSTGPNFQYLWSATAGGHIVNGGDALTPLINTAGVYNLLITNTLNGCTSSNSVSVTQNIAVPALEVTEPAPLNCSNPVVTLQGQNHSPAGNFTYHWTTSGGNILSGANTLNPTVDAGGSYTLQATDLSNGCSSSAAVSLSTNFVHPDAALATPNIINCHNVSVELLSSSSTDPALLTHTWTRPDGSLTSTGANPALNVTQAGNYQLVITNTQNGCTGSATVSVIKHDPVSAVLTAHQDAACFDAADGSADVSAGGGTGVYQYLWSNGTNTAAVSNLIAGTYVVTITDQENCSATATAQINAPSQLVVQSSSTATTGIAEANGTATATPSGGTPDYTYLWDNGQNTQTISGLLPGFYTVTVTDGHGCSQVLSIEVPSGSCNISAAITAADPSCHGLSNGTATITASGGTAPFKYHWSTGGSGQTENNLPPGTHQVTITDVNNCTYTDSVTLSEPALLSIALDSTVNTSCPNTPAGAATVNASGGTGALDIKWSDGQSGPIATGLIAGTYTAIATDVNGCTASVSATIQAIDLEAPVIQAAPVNLALGNSGSITPSLSNLGASVTDNCKVGSVQIQPVSFNCSQLGAQTVTITAFDESGNSSTQTVAVTIIDDIAPVVNCPASVTHCATEHIVAYPAPVAIDNCLAFGGSFQLVTGLPSGSSFPTGVTTNTYSFTDGQGNTGSCSFDVTILSPLVVSLDQVINDVSNQHIGGVQITPTGSQAPYTYQWLLNGQPVSSSEDLSGVGAGSYTLVVTDASNCTKTAGPFVVSNTSGTNSPDWADFIGIYPNPTAGLVYVVLPDELVQKDLVLTVFDLTGRKMMELQGAGQKKRNLDLSNLPDGLYSVQIRIDQQQVMRKIVVNR